MKEQNLFLNLSPLDHRYYLSNQKEHEALARYLSEEANIRTCIEVEIALLKALIAMDPGIKDKPALAEAISKVSASITPEEVYEEEEKTQHNIRAIVNVLKKRLPVEIKHLVHLGATSMDILDTSNSYRMKQAVEKVTIPLLVQLEELLIGLSLEHASTTQIGRTHGQFAVPITFGYAMAEYVSRLGKAVANIAEKADDLRGKLSGAVGAYNSLRMITGDPEKLESDYLAFIGLKPSEHSTQIIEPEYLLKMLLAMNIAFGIIANLADDLRNLQRSEIGEVREEFKSDQVGSSTMPQKRNPWNSEHVKSLWKAFSPRVMTFFMDQISEHQRDLTNSASSRFVAEYITGFTFAVKRMIKILSGLHVDKSRMLVNLGNSQGMIFAESAYIILALNGVSEAHEIIKQVTLQCEKNKSSMIDALKQNPKYWTILDRYLTNNIGTGAEEFFMNPAHYTGIAADKAKRISLKYSEIMKNIKNKL